MPTGRVPFLPVARGRGTKDLDDVPIGMTFWTVLALTLWYVFLTVLALTHCKSQSNDKKQLLVEIPSRTVFVLGTGAQKNIASSGSSYIFLTRSLK